MCNVLYFLVIVQQDHFKSLESRQDFLRSLDPTLPTAEQIKALLNGRLPIIHFSHRGLKQATIEVLLCFPLAALQDVFRPGKVLAFPHLFIIPSTLVRSFCRHFHYN